VVNEVHAAGGDGARVQLDVGCGLSLGKLGRNMLRPYKECGGHS